MPTNSLVFPQSSMFWTGKKSWSCNHKPQTVFSNWKRANQTNPSNRKWLNPTEHDPNGSFTFGRPLLRGLFLRASFPMFSVSKRQYNLARYSVKANRKTELNYFKSNLWWRDILLHSTETFSSYPRNITDEQGGNAQFSNSSLHVSQIGCLCGWLD